jgi:hypothetical protein
VAFKTFPPNHSIFAESELNNGPEYIRQQDQWYSLLGRLLSRNRRTNVCDDRGNRYTNVNNFYNCSFDLLKENSTSLRPLFVATALTDGTSANFQYAALLLSDHTDMLCEFLQDEVTIDS